MPIVSKQEDVGLRRYAVFSFVEDLDVLNNNGKECAEKKSISQFLKCPLTSPAEVARKLKQTELFHMKRLISLEKKVFYPYVDITFFTYIEGVDQIRNLVEPKDCVNLHDPTIKLQKALYEELQIVDPKRDKMDSPVEYAFEDSFEESLAGAGSKSRKSMTPSSSVDSNSKKLRGYIVIAYKTMEHMYKRDFVKSWKTWTGVRYICMQLPRQLGIIHKLRDTN